MIPSMHKARAGCNCELAWRWGCYTQLPGFASPKRSGLTYLDHGADHLACIGDHMRHIIRVHAAAEIGPGKKFDHVRQRCDAFIGIRRKRCPIAYMCFRPEEIHRTSGIADVLEPLVKRHGHIGVKSQSLLVEYFAVMHFQVKGLSAIQAGKIHPHRFPGEKPADRQRFKASLAIPFLLPINRDAILGWLVVKGSKRGNVVRIRV